MDEQPEDAWNRITGSLESSSDEELWDQLRRMADYRGGDAEQNLTLAAIVHALAGRDAAASEAFEDWKAVPGDEPAGHIAQWMLARTGRSGASG
ncbi:hypothetical protein [Longispora albida]|uniref:hypothetical protein n=1 Tax=Longispora albida TaxID=203523 RepID=UPI0012FAD651|nr:hypothetical protein [Longispora albida]